MDRIRLAILNVFKEKDKIVAGSSISASQMSKILDISLENLYQSCLSLEVDGYVTINSFTRGSIDDPNEILGFWIELEEEGEKFLNK